MSAKFQAPRGTHDVLPADAAWWHVVRTMEELAALYGCGRIQTPGFEDTALFARTAGEASDVVHKEMYTFTDRSDRSLTLRPEGTAPIARAYLEHGLHREPQPVKAYTIAPMYRYGAPGRGPLPRALAALGRGDRLGRARRSTPRSSSSTTSCCGALGVTEWELHAELDRRRDCRPAYVERLNEWLDAHADVLDEDARHKRATSPLQVFDVKNPHVRAALADAPKIGESLCDACREHFDDVRRYLDALRRAVHARRRRSSAASTTTRARPSSSSAPTRTRTRRSAAAAATTGSSRRSAARRRPAIGFGAGIERLLLALENEGVASRSRALDVFFVARRRAPRDRVLAGCWPSCGAQGSARRHRLRRPLAQGPDDAGGADRRARRS